MPKIVLDTNVLISALIRVGRPRRLLQRAYEGKFIIILSKEMLDEFLEVSSRTCFREFVNDDEVTRFARALIKIADFVIIRSKFKVINEDPNDDIIINTAIDGRADYIVS